MIVVRSSGRSVGRVLDAGCVNEDKVIVSKKFSPASLSPVENFRRHEGFKILVIGEYLDRMPGSFEVMAPMFYRFDDGEHFAVMNVIVEFGRDTFSRIECDRVPDMSVELADNARDCKVGCVGMNSNRENRIEMLENWRGGESEF